MRATLVPLLARAAPAVRPSIAARSPSRWVAMSAKGKGKKGGDANDAKDGYGGEASVGKATGGQTSADALTAAALGLATAATVWTLHDVTAADCAGTWDAAPLVYGLLGLAAAAVAGSARRIGVRRALP